MLLITSAFPHLKRFDENGIDVGKEHVRQCIESWQANGFRILSVHNKAEESMLTHRFPGVDYRFVDEQLGPGARKTPSFAAVLADLPPDEPIGIINADIFMVPVPGIAERMAAMAAESTLVMHRWEIPSLTARQGACFDKGVDLLVFTPSRIQPALDAFVKLPFQLGVPWWDYALPVAASLYAPLVLVTDPILLHHTHDQAWNNDEWHRFGGISADYLAAQANEPSADRTLAAELRRRLLRIDRQHRDTTRPKERDYSIAELTLRWIHVESGRRPVSLVSGMSLPPSGLELDLPWTELPWVEPPPPAIETRVETADAAKDEEEIDPFLRMMPIREFRTPPILSLFQEISTESPAFKVVGAGLRDLFRVVLLTGKLLERRFRRFLRRRRRPADTRTGG